MSGAGSQLEVLVELRERERDEAQQILADHNAEAARLRREIEQLEADLADRRRREAGARDGVSATDIAALRRADEFRRALEIEIEQLEETRRQRQGELDAALQRVAEARGELAEREAAVQAVQTRLDAHEHEERVLQKRRREAEMDEVALRRWKESSE